ncbi:hypothetical protein BDM02DRAFT_3189484 [Thelephora ganbajun]|uniref:Uncharacterized protein n=1 Tax=Thelephora ganbajun TaxID=370292 RepID=A0ACB6Z7P1_THEGA|nr:hypothetical protein BDM02DRAFT_3189484 [Thelephora ganbajun]
MLRAEGELSSRSPAPSEAAMVLSSLPEAMSRRQRIQVSHSIRIPPQMLVVGGNVGRHIADFSGQFQHDFVQLLSRRFCTKRVKANTITLTEFVKHLGRTGVARVDETEKGWFIAWIDNSPKALEKQEAALKKERSTMSDEQRERLLIIEQIERAKAEEEEQGALGSGSPGSPSPAKEGLKQEEGTEKVILSFSAKPVAATTTTTPSVGLKLNTNPLKANLPERPNVFKTSTSNSTPSTSTSPGTKRHAPPQSVAERLIFEDQERKRRKMEREAA